MNTSMNDESQNRIATAHHEAGHVVADVRSGFSVAYVTILPGDGTLGGSGNIDHPLGINPTQETKDQVVIALLAGYAADVRFGTDETLARGGASNDFERAEELLDENHSIEDWIPKAAKFVEENWKVIQVVAEQLVEHGTLAGTEIECIVDWADTDNPEHLEVLTRYRLLKEYRG